jgi:hypothetical protein
MLEDFGAVEETTPLPAFLPTITPFVDAAGRPDLGATDFEVFGLPAIVYMF